MERLQGGKECFRGISDADHVERIKLAIWAVFTVAFSDCCCLYLTSIFPSVLQRRGSFFSFPALPRFALEYRGRMGDDGRRGSYLRMCCVHSGLD